MSTKRVEPPTPAFPVEAAMDPFLLLEWHGPWLFTAVVMIVNCGFVDLFVGKQSLKEMLVGTRRWLWLLGAGAAVCGGSYMIYTAWCAVPLPIRINIRTPCFANRQHKTMGV